MSKQYMFKGANSSSSIVMRSPQVKRNNLARHFQVCNELFLNLNHLIFLFEKFIGKCISAMTNTFDGVKKFFSQQPFSLCFAYSMFFHI